MKFSRIAAGMINTKAIQLQFLLNQASLSARFNMIKRTIDANPQGNIRNVEGLLVWIAIARVLLDRKVENIRDKIKKPSCCLQNDF